MFGYYNLEFYNYYFKYVKKFNYIGESVALQSLYIAIAINLRNWIFFFIKIGSLAPNPYARDDIDNCVNDKYFPELRIEADKKIDEMKNSYKKYRDWLDRITIFLSMIFVLSTLFIVCVPII